MYAYSLVAAHTCFCELQISENCVACISFEIGRIDLASLDARLEDEYELEERAAALEHKLDVIVATAHALPDIIDADRATRLEATVVILIVFELIASLIQIALAWRGRERLFLCQRPNGVT